MEIIINETKIDKWVARTLNTVEERTVKSDLKKTANTQHREARREKI
jgi:hypothetical protein